VGFDQHPEAVAQLEVATGETRRGNAIGEAGGRVVVLDERRLERQCHRALGVETLDHAIAQHGTGFSQFRIAST
jgi:hypothetical protein